MLKKKEFPVLVAGGGIGGLAAALALVRQGYQVTVLEQAPEIGEIGAGIQLGPNAFHAFDALGVGDKARGRAAYTDYMVLHDAIDAYQVGKIPKGETFLKRFGNPYAVIHRQDIHNSLLEGAQETGKVAFITHTRVECVEQTDTTVTAHDPLRGGEQYNIVMTRHSRQQEQWDVTDGRKEEVESHFQGICPKARQRIELPRTWKRWASADREPIDNRVYGRATIPGDAAHPTTQYMAQGAWMAPIVLSGREMGRHVPCRGRGAPGAQQPVEGPHARALPRRHGMAVWLERGQLPGPELN